MKINKKLLVITTLLILLPMVFGIVYWEQLPETMATHFNINNEPDGWSSKATVVFGMPLIMAALHIFGFFMTFSDPKKNNIGKKPIGIVYWLVPVISVALIGSSYAIALGKEVDIGMVCCLLMGILFIVLGNYMPKAKQNFTFGYKIPWTLNSEENWNRTHRLAGWLSVACGFVFILNAFFFLEWVFLAAAIVMTLIPIAYSYILYKKGI